jgi:hypothetical protein
VHHPEAHWQFTGKELLEHGGRSLAPIRLPNAARASLKCEPATPLRATASHSGETKGEGSPLQLGGADLYVAAERVSQQPLPHDVQGSFLLEPREGRYGFVPLYIMGRQKDDAKVWTSPLFITWR